MMEVTLSGIEISEADGYAAQVEREVKARNAAPTQQGIKRSQSFGNRLGYRAQRAFCKAIGIPWSPKAAFTGPNVGERFKVKGRQRYAGIAAELKVTERDRDDLVFVHVSSEDHISFRIEGWLLGRDAKRQEWLRDDGYPAFTVPNSALHSMETLPIDPSVMRKPAEGESGAAPSAVKLA